MAAIRSWFDVTPAGRLSLDGVAVNFSGITWENIDLFNFGSNTVYPSITLIQTGAINLSALNISQGQTITFVLANGTQIKVTNSSQGGSNWIGLVEMYDSNGNYIRDQDSGTGAGWSVSVHTNGTETNYFGICDLKDRNTQIVYRGLCSISVSNNGNSCTIDRPNTTFSAALGVPVVPEYQWRSWPGLAGNNGNYQIELAQIVRSAIGDGTPEIVTSDGSIFTLPAISSLRRICANLQEGVETTVLWCGDNYATATRRTVEGIGTNIVNITFKFYYRSGTLAFTAPEQVGWYEGGSTVSPEVYISIMYDSEEETASTNFIQYAPNNGNYKYNLSELQVEQQLKQLYIWLQDNGQYHEQGDPYDTGSEDDGGEPGTPRPQDPIGDTSLPTISGLNMGIVTLYHPDDTQVAAISQFLWSDNVLDNFKKYFNNFADNILSLYILPYTPASLPTKTFKVGNMTSEITGVEYVTARFYDEDMGSVEVLPRWGSYLDYAPYTKIEIYLPYLGSHSLDVDEIMSPTKQDGTLPTGQGSKLKLKYRLDILTGIIVAKIYINNELRYQFEGKCGASIPLTGQTYASMVQGIVQAGAGLATTIATGGLTAPLSAAAAVAGTVNATKPSIERVGNISGDASMMSSKIPFITISSPSKPYLDTQQKYTGYPSYKAATLGSFSGYTQVIEAHVEGISCTEEERTLILKWLKEGVII